MRPLIGTSWKMNLTSSEAAAWFDGFLPQAAEITDRDLFVLPPFTAIWVARQRLAGTSIAWGAQDVSPDEAGAHTGDIAASMLAELGCSIVEIGHSERRRDHAETGPLIARKVRAVLAHGMRPLLCIGEPSPAPLDETVALLLGDMAGCLDGAGDELSRLIVAYEPWWAIGEGAVPADPGVVGQVHGAIHDWLSDHGAPAAPVIYGGSVDADAAPGLLATPRVDGLFVGRYALNPANFARIATAPIRQEVGR